MNDAGPGAAGRVAGLAERGAVDQLRALGELLPGIVYQLYFDGRELWQFTFVSRRVEQMLGVSVEAALADADTLMGRIHPDDAERVMAESLACAQSPSPWHGEFRMRHEDGHWIWVEAHDLPQRLSDGGLLWTGYANDISARKAAEQQLHVQSTALEAAANAIVITDPRGHIEWANAAFVESTGFTLEEARGQRPGDLFRSGQHDAAFYARLWTTILGGRVWQGHVVNRRRDGALRTEEMTITPVKNASGDITHFIAVKQDITERLQLEEQLRRTQRVESIGQLSGGIAHDFNNLLTVILGNAELIDEALDKGSRLRPLAEMVVKGAQRGAELTHRLLAFARKQSLDPRPVDVNRLVGDLADMLQRTLGGDTELEFCCEEPLSPALVDPGQLEDALLNLVINARDAMSGGGRLVVETANAELEESYTAHFIDVEPGRYVMLAVSDSGVGIAAADLDRVFEPFYTTKDKGSNSGLGLSMVYGFVKQSRGHIRIYSEPGQGTTVKMYLPPAPQLQTAAAPRTARPAHHGRGELVLVVEDDALVRDYVEHQITALGYQVLSAGNGAEAQALLGERDDIALLFTDIVMPGGMNGRELAQVARALRPGLPVLYTSGYTQDAALQRGALEPGAQLLSKPYRRAELAEKLYLALAGDDVC